MQPLVLSFALLSSPVYALLGLWPFLGDLEFWKYVSIPFVAGLVGWGTNWAAIELTFKPLRFVGIRPFLGWQGIIPSKAGRMAAIFVDSTMIKLGTLPELFQQMEPEKIGDQVVRVIRPRLRRYTDEIMFREDDQVWRNTPEVVKERIYERVEGSLPDLVDGLLEETSRRIDELVDFKHMVVTRLTEDPALLNRLFLESGSAEFRFIIRSGLYFGFLFGLVQLAVWYHYPAAWVLPVFGMLVGWATNWIAINVIFRPLHPVRLGPFVLQGIFLKRQAEVAGAWTKLVSKEIVSIRAIVHTLVNGKRSETMRGLIRRHMEPIVGRAVAPYRLPVELAVGPRTLDGIRRTVGRKSVEVATEPFDDWHFNRDRSEVVERMLHRRMVEMPPEDFQGLLRPCFQEDELKLILVGAALGFVAGLSQLVFVFGGL